MANPVVQQPFNQGIDTGKLFTQELADGNNVTQIVLDDDAFVLIDGFPIDVALSEGHSYDSEVTEYPVEDGADVTDNIRPKPITVTIEGLVSDSPLDTIRLSRVTRGGGPDAGVLPSTEAYLRLLRIREKREPVVITTSLDQFPSMALKTLSIPRSSGEPHGLRFHATFVQIQIVTTNRANRVAMPIAASGEQQGHAASKSAFSDLLNDLGKKEDDKDPGAVGTVISPVSNSSVRDVLSLPFTLLSGGD